MTRLAPAFIILLLCAVATVTADVTTPPARYDPAVCAAADNTDLALALAAANSADCLAMMLAFPAPRLSAIPHDSYTLERASYWRVGPEGALLYDAPGGAAIGEMAAGFNYIRAVDTSVDGWLQRAGGEWLRRDDATRARPSRFRGHLLPAGWTQPFAIILDRTGIYASLKPGAPPSADSGYITRRYQLVNIFASARAGDGRIWYLIGPQQWIRQEFLAKVAPVSAPAGVTGRWLAVDLFEQTLIAYEDGMPVFATLISSGLPDWSTEEGIFEIWARLTSDSMVGAQDQPDAYALQRVPWVLYFDGAIGFHGTYWHDSFGYRHSHGCVNVSVSDARWLFEWTAGTAPRANGETLNQVYVFSSGQYAD